MPRFMVSLSRVEYKTAKIEVEAEDEADAEDVALEAVEDSEWEICNADENVGDVEPLDDDDEVEEDEVLDEDEDDEEEEED